jgi:Ran GTPase-activating protein (RanGAP) involved in mRNA processing and transport
VALNQPPAEYINFFHFCTFVYNSFSSNLTQARLLMVWGSSGKKGIDDLLRRVDNEGLESLTILGVRAMGAAEAEKLSESLAASTCCLTELQAGGHDIGVDGAAALGRALSSNKTLLRLSVGHQAMGDEGIGALLEGGLLQNTALEFLDLEGKSASECTAVASLLSSHPTLLHLNLARNCIGDQGVEVIAQALPQSSSLTQLDLSSNLFGAQGAAALAAALPRSRLRHLTLSKNGIGEEGGEVLGTSLGQCSNLQSLSLSECALGTRTAVAISNSLLLSTTLQRLDLSGNPGICVNGVSLLSSSLRRAKSRLAWLSLASCALGDEGAAALGESFPGCLVHLDITRCGVSGKGAASLLEDMGRDDQTTGLLGELRLFGNTLGDECVSSLCEAALRLLHLRVLDLGGCGMTDEGVAYLVDRLSLHPCLEILELGGNEIGVKAEKIIQCLLGKQSKLDIAYRQG